MILERLHVGSDPIPGEDYYDTKIANLENQHKKKLTDLYYDLAVTVDSYNDFGRWRLLERLNKFFQDNLNKSL